jgi:DNA-binding NarL/FixJ family response regulator
LSRQKRPDVLLLDIVMPDGSGLEVAEKLVGLARAPRILVLSAYNDPEYIRHLMEHGANGYLTKDQVPTHIIEAVRAVARGDGRWFVPSVPTAVTLKSRLTDREQEVLRALAEGHSNQEIADVLNVSENTIRTHTSHLYDKLDVASAREAISLAWQSGFMRVE